MRYLIDPLFAVTLAATDQPTPMPVPAKLMRIVESVQKNILGLPEYSLFDDIRFFVKDDTVILTGEASRPILKSAAESAVKGIEGVERVENRIEVLQGLSLDPPIGYHPIHIIVRNQKLKLTGVVQNIGDKTIAGLIANTIPGTFGVENNLAIADEMKPIRHEKAKKGSAR